MRTLISLLLCVQCAACELLVRIADKKPLLDADEQRAGRTTVGMVISVRDDGFKWGKLEGPPQYAIVKLPGLSKKDFVKYTLQEFSTNDTQVVYRARVYKLDTSKLDATTLASLTNNTLAATALTAASVWSSLKTNMLNITLAVYENDK